MSMYAKSLASTSESATLVFTTSNVSTDPISDIHFSRSGS